MFKLFSERPVPVRQPVFVVGCGRSGTTLMFDLLKLHADLAPTTGHPDGEDHVGWIEHGGAVISGLANPHRDTGHVGFHFCLHMNESDVTDGVRESMHRYYSTEVLKGQEGKRVLNKCPHISNKLRYVLAIFPDAFFVHIVREPVAVVASWVNVMQAVPELLLYWPDSDFPCFWVLEGRRAHLRGGCVNRESRLFPGGGLLRLADYWAAVNANIPRQLAQAPARGITIRYEDLIERPESELRRITDFCGLPPLTGVELPIIKGRNTVHRGLLSDDDVDAIRSRVRTTAEQFGYAPSSDREIVAEEGTAADRRSDSPLG